MNMLEVIVAGAGWGAPDQPAPPLQCPFCGSDPSGARRVAGRFLVGCEADHCHVNPQVSGHSLEQAWTRWNKRGA